MKKQVIVFGISKDIQFKGMKHVDVRTYAEKLARVAPKYKLVSKATGKDIMTYAKGG